MDPAGSLIKGLTCVEKCAALPIHAPVNIAAQKYTAGQEEITTHKQSI